MNCEWNVWLFMQLDWLPPKYCWFCMRITHVYQQNKNQLNVNPYFQATSAAASACTTAHPHRSAQWATHLIVVECLPQPALQHQRLPVSTWPAGSTTVLNGSVDAYNPVPYTWCFIIMITVPILVIIITISLVPIWIMWCGLHAALAIIIIIIMRWPTHATERLVLFCFCYLYL